MRLLVSCTLLLSAAIPSLVLADFLGSNYPPPSDLSSPENLVAQAWTQTSALFDASPNTSNSTPAIDLCNITFSASLFSIHDGAATKLQ